MNGHALGERAGWVLAAAFVALGSTTIGGSDRPVVPLGSPTAQTGTAAEDVPAFVDRYLIGDAAGPTAWASGPAAALAADAFAWPVAAPTVVSTKPVAVVKPAPKPTGVWWAKYQGTNHVWMPTLGINKPVYLFPCSRGTDPDNLVYRWGCAGTNNVYLLGHAYGVFKALHDAYYNGKLKVGMPVVYADGSGREHLYRVTTWRIVNPVDAAWAIASQPRPSMTLQTCVGADGSLRLNVRLVEVNS
ncbi:MAG: sortase [Chloroflexi bacterium]|nr:sortase [Chloroflexota bacterium]